jgi:hypothetical protein
MMIEAKAFHGERIEEVAGRPVRHKRHDFSAELR